MSLLRDDKGNMSTMRIIVIMIVLAVLVNWIILNVKAPAGTVVGLDWKELLMIATAVVGKLGQKKLEG